MGYVARCSDRHLDHIAISFAPLSAVCLAVLLDGLAVTGSVQWHCAASRKKLLWNENIKVEWEWNVNKVEWNVNKVEWNEVLR